MAAVIVPDGSPNGLQRRVVDITFRAAAVKAFRTLWVEWGILLETLNQVRVSNVITTKRNRIDQTATNQIICFRNGVGTGTNDGTREEITHFLTECVGVRLTTGPVWL